MVVQLAELEVEVVRLRLRVRVRTLRRSLGVPTVRLGPLGVLDGAFVCGASRRQWQLPPRPAPRWPASHPRTLQGPPQVVASVARGLVLSELIPVPVHTLLVALAGVASPGVAVLVGATVTVPAPTPASDPALGSVSTARHRTSMLQRRPPRLPAPQQAHRCYPLTLRRWTSL